MNYIYEICKKNSKSKNVLKTMLSKIRRPSQSQMFNFILIDLYRPDFKRLAPMLQ